jgi:UDP-glucose 4-epimerase
MIADFVQGRTAMPDRVLVTGGAGFIGSHIARRLLSDGHDVRIFDNFATGKRSNIADVESRCEVVEGDVRDAGAVARAVSGCRFVFHEAALGSVPRSVSDPLEAHDVNSTGTLTVLVAARDAGVERLVFASSSSVYGDAAELPKRESARPQPLSPYALSKLYGEQACVIFSSLYRIEAVALRYFNVFGPFQDPDSQYAAVIPRFATALLAGERPVIYGDGEQSRDFTYVDNVVEANMCALRAPADRAIRDGGGIFNASVGGRASLLDLVAAMNAALGTDIRPVHEEARPGDVKHSQAATDKAREFLGYAPTVTFDDGLRRTLDWYRGAAGGR